MKKLPFVSIVISIYNAESTLRKCLETIKNIDYLDYEVILVDDKSKDDSVKIAKEFPFKLIQLKENKGVAGARNVGVRKAKGEIVVITDADCEVKKDWLKNLIKPFEDENVGIVGGPDKAPEDDTFFARCVDYAWTSFIGTGGMRRGKFRVANYYPRGCNIAIRKKIFEEIGYFNKDIVPGEEIDFDIRAKKHGYKLKYVDNALVLHRRRPTLSRFIRHLIGRGKFRVVLGKAHKELLEPLHIIPALFVVFVVFGLILSLFSNFILKTYTILMTIYFTIIFISGIDSAIKIKDIRAVIVTPFILFLQHFLYGVGFFKGLLE